MDQLEQRFYWLDEHVKSGKSRPEIEPGLRNFPEGRHIIFYRFNGDMLEIARLLHRSMDVEQHLSKSHLSSESTEEHELK